MVDRISGEQGCASLTREIQLGTGRASRLLSLALGLFWITACLRCLDFVRYRCVGLRHRETKTESGCQLRNSRLALHSNTEANVTGSAPCTRHEGRLPQGCVQPQLDADTLPPHAEPIRDSVISPLRSARQWIGSDGGVATRRWSGWSYHVTTQLEGAPRSSGAFLCAETLGILHHTPVAGSTKTGCDRPLLELIHSLRRPTTPPAV